MIGRLKNEYIKILTDDMRDSGYVPRLDIDPDFTIGYNKDKQYFEFELSIHAIYIGKKQSKWITGVDGTVAISTHQNKSSVSSQAQV